MGFYEKLEKISERIDAWFMFLYESVMDFEWNVKNIGFLYYVPGMSKLAWLRWSIKMNENQSRELIEEYNREKFFWMAKK